jgi:3-hydroxyisobutyrate dehydrogenase-like beta-hydroxyacid dehydrogenase
MSINPIRQVGMIGLGKMGLPMARHLHKHGFDVIAYDIDPSACASAGKLGIKVAATAKAVAADSDFVIVVVGFDGEVERVVGNSDGIIAANRPGLILGIASTIAPQTMLRLAAKATEAGIKIIDMPLTRGETAAEAGNLLVMLGGDGEVVALCEPVLKSFAGTIVHLGEAGSAQVGKMVNNLILWACISANHEGFKIARQLGVDTERLRTALLASSASNWALEVRPEEQPMPWAEKDMRILMAEADRARVSLPLCGVVAEVVKTVKYEHGWPTPQALPPG